jgi:hypothetical protein
MVTERQIAANRRNAGKSTGPRSRAGKRRARSNAYRHGLTTGIIPSTTLARQIEKLARKIAGNTRNEIVFELARDAAYAEFELARVRRVKLALIERAGALGAPGAPRLFNSAREAIRFLNSVVQGKTPAMPNPVDPSATIPAEEIERTAEAIRRALPELVKLDRYESRAAARRDKAVQRITKSRISKNNNR